MPPRNTNYVRRLAQQGKDAPTIYQRILERLTWDGPYPSFSEVVEICDDEQLSALRLRSGAAKAQQAKISASTQEVLRNDPSGTCALAGISSVPADKR